MTRPWIAAAAMAAVWGMFGAARAEDGYGTLTGQFVLDGTPPARTKIVMKGDPTVKDGAVCAADDLYSDELIVDPATKGIANIFVYITARDAKKLTIHPSLKESATKEVVFDQKGCRFEPHCLVLRTDQSVVVKSDDDIAHNTHSYTVKNDAFNFLVAPKDRKGIPVKLMAAETLPMPIKCDIHPWMRSHWLILDHPYAALTDKEGKFKIENVPAGEHEFRVWHERAGYVNNKWKQTVKAGSVTNVPAVKVPLADLNKPTS